MCDSDSNDQGLLANGPTVSAWQLGSGCREPVAEHPKIPRAKRHITLVVVSRCVITVKEQSKAAIVSSPEEHLSATSFPIAFRKR